MGVMRRQDEGGGDQPEVVRGLETLRTPLRSERSLWPREMGLFAHDHKQGFLGEPQLPFMKNR